MMKKEMMKEMMKEMDKMAEMKMEISSLLMKYIPRTVADTGSQIHTKEECLVVRNHKTLTKSF